MLLLAIDTSTSAITAAVHDGEHVVARRSVLDARAHGEQLAPVVAEVLQAAGADAAAVTAVAVGVGPGPFTGLRVGLVTARVFAHARSLPVWGVSSLAALAHEAFGTHPDLDRVAVATDARRKELYVATYDRGADGVPVAVREPAVGRPADVAPALAGLTVAGRGPLLHPDLVAPSLGLLDVDAGWLADLAVRIHTSGAAPLPPEPAYLRRPDALTTAERAAARR